MTEPLLIGGAPVGVLTDPHATSGFIEAAVLPGRGMMLLQARVRTGRLGEFDALTAPPPVQAAAALDGGPEDFAGSKGFSFGAAILLPYANRITGEDAPGAREVAAQIAGRRARLPRNWGGQAPGARRYAMHGLILAARAEHLRQPSPNVLEAALPAGDFGGRWPGCAEVAIRYTLSGGALELEVRTTSLGPEPLPLGVGWHPYVRLPSGRREQALLRVPACARALVNDYDEVLPTGALEPVAGTAYDFRAGRPLGGLYLDDCFTELMRDAAGRVTAEIVDPAAGYGLRISTPTAEVKAVQVYAPPDQPFVVLEPQFNLADPYSPVWPPDVDTGMALAPPGACIRYQVRLEVFTPEVRLGPAA